MNDIAVRQDEERFQELQGAWKMLYAYAVRLFYVQAVLTALIPVLFAVCILAAPVLWSHAGGFLRAMKVIAGLYAVTVVLLDAMWLEPEQQRLRKKAAAAQEIHDTELFRLPYSSSSRPPLEPEEVRSLSRRWRAVDSNPTHMQGWYPLAIGRVPIEAGRVIAQRASVRWDADLRRRYARRLLLTAIAFPTGCVLWGLVGQLSLGATLIAVGAGAPGIRWALRERGRHITAAEQVTLQLDRVNGILRRILDGSLSGKAAERESRELQDLMYERRQTSPVGLPWLYRRLRDESEDAMNAAAELCVHDYLEHPSRTRSR